jgi:hypothetical protein
MNVLDEKFEVTEALKSDKGGANLRALKDALTAIQTKLRRAMDKGLPGRDFTVASNLHKSCMTAQNVLEQFWAQPKK